MIWNILLVEDDSDIHGMVSNYLSLEGYHVISAYNGEEAILKFLNTSVDLVLLDIMMPKRDGLEVLKIIRERSHLPVIILSAKDSDVDKAVGLGFGADDYIAKPFSMLELSARIKAAIRRSTLYSDANMKDEQWIRFNGLSIDLKNYTVLKNDEDVRLTAKEFEILKLFAMNPGRVFTKGQVYKAVWEEEYFGDENVINVHIRRLREKIEADPSNPQHIKTVWGIGYRLGEG